MSCKKQRVFDNKNSTSYKQLHLGVEVTFGTGNIAGETNEDIFNFGNIEKTTFWWNSQWKWRCV